MPLLLIKLFFSGLISFLITLFLIPLLRKIAVRLGVVDVPDGKIKQHEKVTPYLGGVGVYAGFISGLALVFPVENQLFFLLVGVTLLLFLGLIDDLVALRPYQKFFGQLLAAFCFLKGGLFLKEQFFYDFWYIGVLISLVWILTIINAFNLVDVMDGLSSVIAINATVSFLIIALVCDCSSVALLLTSFLGPLLAFLWYNYPPAQIYLGDAGSLFIGGFLATVPFLFRWSQFTSMGYLAPAIILTIPLLEVTTLIVVRTYRGIPFYNASPDHFSIYLRKKGWSKPKILGYMVVVATALLLITLSFLFDLISLKTLVLLGLLGILVWYGILLRSPQ
jgi:UDP-GlcNAc:undecaprenyl-phosphate GlcNAc-1-phosphate transferase